MERTKLIFKEEREKILYPEKQKDLFIRMDSESMMDIGIGVIPSNKTSYTIPKGEFMLLNHSEITAHIGGKFIYTFVRADLSNDTLGTWNASDETTILLPGLYFAHSSSKGITINVVEDQKVPAFQSQNYFILSKDIAEDYVKSSRFRLYNNKYIVINFQNLVYLPLFMKRGTLNYMTSSPKCSVFNSKSIFKEFFFGKTDEYVVCLVPIQVTSSFSGSNNLLLDANKISTFTIDDINNF